MPRLPFDLGRAPRLALRGASVTFAAIGLSLVTASSPVLATCVAVNEAFPPGLWQGVVANLATLEEDGMGVAVTDGTGSFWLRVDDDGNVDEGWFEFEAMGFAEAWDDLEHHAPGAYADDSASAARFTTFGPMSGTANSVFIDGDMIIEMQTIIDVNEGEGPDEYSGSGNDLYGWEAAIETRYEGSLSPHTPGCGTIFGTMTAPVGFGQPDVHFYAMRLGGKATQTPDLESRLVSLMDDAEFFIDMQEFDSDAFARWLSDLLAFDALMVSLESCNPDRVDTVGPAWDMARSTILNSVRIFLRAAGTGAYETTDVIRAMTVFLQGGALGWRGDECLEPTRDEIAEELFVTFESILIQRLELAWEAGDAQEIARIQAAAYQFGLGRLISVITGGAQ